MSTPLRLLPALLALAACGGRTAVAQSPAPPEDGLARPYIYDVAPEQVSPQEAPPFLEVSGSATVKVAPDRALASFAVESQAKTATEAAGANADAMDAVVRALGGAGIRGMRVETFGYSLRPDYAYPTTPAEGERTRVIAGYTALNNVRVTMEDVEAVGRVIDLAIGAGTNRVSSLAFEASDTEAARREALTQAVRQATLEAEAIAAALGRMLGDPLEVRGGAQAPTPRVQMDAMRVAFEAAQARAETPIEAGEQSVQANVTIKFSLGGRVGGR